MEILLGKNPVNQPFDEQGVEQKHQAAQYHQGHAQQMRAQERAQLAGKPTELRIRIRSHEHSQQFRCTYLTIQRSSAPRIHGRKPIPAYSVA